MTETIQAVGVIAAATISAIAAIFAAKSESTSTTIQSKRHAVKHAGFLQMSA